MRINALPNALGNALFPFGAEAQGGVLPPLPPPCVRVCIYDIFSMFRFHTRFMQNNYKRYIYIYIYIYIQGRIQDLAQGGGQIGREAPEKFFVPPLSSSGGGTVPPLKLHSPKILHHLLNEFTRKYQEKNLCPPPESLRGGTFWLSPPWIAQAGDNSQGGDSPPPEIAQGGDSPLVPPPVSALVLGCFLCIMNHLWNRK